MRTNLENSLEEYYRLQNKYFDNYGTLCNIAEEGDHPDLIGEKSDYCECSDDCDYKCSDDDNCDCATKNEDDFNPITIHMTTYRPFKDTYPHLWKFFGGK